MVYFIFADHMMLSIKCGHGPPISTHAHAKDRGCGCNTKARNTEWRVTVTGRPHSKMFIAFFNERKDIIVMIIFSYACKDVMHVCSFVLLEYFCLAACLATYFFQNLQPAFLRSSFALRSACLPATPTYSYCCCLGLRIRIVVGIGF